MDRFGLRQSSGAKAPVVKHLRGLSRQPALWTVGGASYLRRDVLVVLKRDNLAHILTQLAISAAQSCRPAEFGSGTFAARHFWNPLRPSGGLTFHLHTLKHQKTDRKLNLSFCFCSSGAIEHRDRPNTPVKYFTQADVNSGKLVYRPPQAPSHLQELYQYSFMGETAAAARTQVNTLSCSTTFTFIICDKL